MAGLSTSLMIAIWAVAALWLVGAAAYYFGYQNELVWFVALLGAGIALTEWQAIRNRDDTNRKD